MPGRSPSWLHTLSADGSAPTRTFTTVALFFNLDTSRALTSADNYVDTPASAVAPWLAVGTPNRSGFINRYWSALSFGKLLVSVAANTDKASNPVIPTIAPRTTTATSGATSSMATEAWTPDGSRSPGGLLITHVNTRIGEDGSTSTPSSPFQDVEECDGKCWDDRGYCDLRWSDHANNSNTEVGGAAFPSNNWPEPDRGSGTLLPTGSLTSFTPTTNP